MNRKLLIILLALALIPAALAANPGHDASRIEAGTFEGGGTYIFPTNLQANSDFIVDTDTLFVDASTNRVGIGTLSPTSALYVDGNITVNSTYDICIEGGNCLSSVGGGGGSVTGTGSANTIPRWTNSTNLGDSIISESGAAITISGNVTLGGNYYFQTAPASGADTAANDVIIAGGRSTGSAAGGDILFQTSDGPVASTTVQTLSTKGGFSGADFYIDTDTLFVDASTNSVGIGTNSPGEQLYVVGDINATGDICITGGNCLSNVGNGSNSAAGWTNTSSTTSTSLNVDITGTLDASGTTTLTGNLVVDTDTLYVDSASNEVGIGTSAPNAALEVDGGIRLNPSTGRPGCGSGNTGELWYQDSGSGSDDYLWSCMKNSTESYNWILVARGG